MGTNALNVSVIGTVFVDCKGFSHQQYQASGRNLGEIRFVHGGVGRNVAENLVHLQTPTTFVSTIDQSGLGQEILERLQSNHINTEYILQVSERGMGMWLVIIDDQGNIAGSISQMPNLELMEQWIQIQIGKIMESSSHVVLELDLNKTISELVLTEAKQWERPVFGLPGNLDIVSKHPHLLHGLSCFICNEHEASVLLNENIADLDQAQIQSKLIQFIDQHQMESMVITLGEQGCIYADTRHGDAGYFPAEKVNVVDASGAGDSFFSGTVAGLVRDLPLKQAIEIGTKTAAWTVQSTETTCHHFAHQFRKDKTFAPLFDEELAKFYRKKHVL